MWNKIKRIYFKQAQLPTITKHDNYYRIFYSSRINGKSVINYFELEPKTLKIIYQNKKPVLNIGKTGCFDDSGVMPSFIKDDVLYYTGWNTNKGCVPYGHGIGMAVFNHKKNKFERLSNGPILDRCEEIPYLANSPFVIKNKMYFCNGTGWLNKMPLYNISLATYSKKWSVIKHIVGKKNEALSRPFLHKNKIYFSKKTIKNNYEIFSYDIKEKILQKVLSKSKTGWDSDMVCYPWIEDNIMFYNGNNYGETGIGVAEWII